MGDPAIAHLAAVGAVEGHGSVARRAARTRDDESISEAGKLLHAQLGREDRGDGSFYRIGAIPDRGPSSKSAAETGAHLTRKGCRAHTVGAAAAAVVGTHADSGFDKGTS